MRILFSRRVKAIVAVVILACISRVYAAITHEMPEPPYFMVKTISQDNPVAGMMNGVLANLSASWDLPNGTTVTILGLMGSMTEDTESLPVTTTANRLGTMGNWTRDLGRLVLTATSGGVLDRTICTVKFNVMNPLRSQPPPTVFISALIEASPLHISFTAVDVMDGTIASGLN